ncbi:MAG: ribonuclease R [Chitinophagales bacterium]
MKHKSKYIPSAKASVPKNKKSGKTHSSSSKSSPKRISVNDIVLDTIHKLGETPKLHSLFPILLRQFSQEVIINALNRLETIGKIKLHQKGVIEVVKHSRAHRGDEVIGTADITRTGSAYVNVQRGVDDVYIPGKFTHGAMQGDVVRVQLRQKSGRQEGQIVEIVKRARESFIGELDVFEQYAMFTADDHQIRKKFTIELDRLNGAKDGDRVFARVLDWNESGKHPIAEVAEIASQESESDMEMKLILVQNGFHTEFPQDAVSELNKIPDEIPEEEIKKRIDYRNILTFTIDPVDAKDFDDAISFRMLENGNYEVGVHIADVSHYLVQGSELDREAEKRATSVYLPDRVCPMLPERLSNFLCSLRPNEDKLTFSTIFEFNKKFEIEHTTIAKTVIHSRRRFAYEEVQEILEKKAGDYAEELQTVDRIAKHLRKKRFDNGAISFEKDEVRFKLDESGKPLGIYLKVRQDAHLLIEDLMLLSNETVAKFGSKLKKEKAHYPFVYRVHDAPDEAKLDQFARIAKRFGYGLHFKDPRQIAETLNNLLQKVNGKPEQNVLENLAIRTMAKAEYTTKNIGHYGLAMDFYTHFTSPIRRYPDVMVHRLVYEELKGLPHLLSKEDMEEACRNASLMERRAMEAEREATKYKQVEYLQNFLGEEFEGLITGVIPRGFFVELIENKCEGFVDAAQIGRETFVYDEKQIRLKGSRSGRTFDLGQKVKVRIARASLEERKIDFALVN